MPEQIWKEMLCNEHIWINLTQLAYFFPLICEKYKPRCDEKWHKDEFEGDAAMELELISWREWKWSDPCQPLQAARRQWRKETHEKGEG